MTKKDGSVVYGRIIYQDEQEMAIAANPYDFSVLTKVAIDQIDKVELSAQSMMPEGTIAMMNKSELRDLMAYLLSGGNKRDQVFKAR